MSDGKEFDVKRCAKCAAWIPTTATKCSYCDTSSPDEPPARPRGPALSLRHGVSATNALIAANAALFFFALIVAKARGVEGNVLQWALTGSTFTPGAWLCGAYVHQSVAQEHEWWRLISAAFLHYGVIHLALNMLALRDLGALTERLFGTAKFLVVYVLSAIGGNVAVGFWHGDGRPAVVAAGASGAIFGVMGLVTVYLLRAATERSRQVGMMLARDVLMMLGAGLVIPFISNAAHVGGLVVGAACGYVLKDRLSDRFDPGSRRRWTSLAFVAVGLTVGALVAAMWFALTYGGASR